jgi:uncharacterized membrane protein YkvA (DUF1232 family)
MNFSPRSVISNLKRRARQLKSEVHVLAVAYRDKRTPVVAKILAGFTIAYLLSPIDLIPDFIPVLGMLDDLLIVPLLIALSIRLIPVDVLAEARQYVMNNPASFRKNRWWMAVIFVVIWLAGIYVTFRYLYGYFGRQAG